MPITTTCPNCKAIFRLAEEMAGKKASCQKCAAIFVVPAFDGLAAVAWRENVPADEKSPAPVAALPLPPMSTDRSPPIAPEAVDHRLADQAEPEPLVREPVRRRSARYDDRGTVKKAGSSTLPVVLIVLGIGVLFLFCGGVGIAWITVANRPGPDPKDKIAVKEPKAAPAVTQVKPIKINLGPDGKFRHDSELTHKDPTNPVRTRYKLYSLRMEKFQTYQIDMKSKVIDSYLIVTDEKGNVIHEDDDSGGDQNGPPDQRLDARLFFTPQKDGVYHIQATHCSNDLNQGKLPTTGPYTLIVQRVK